MTLQHNRFMDLMHARYKKKNREFEEHDWEKKVILK